MTIEAGASPTKVHGILSLERTESVESWNSFAWPTDKLHGVERKHKKHSGSSISEIHSVQELLVTSEQISQLHLHKTTKSGTVSRNGGVLNTSVREQAHLKNRFKKRSTGRFWKHTKSSHVNACYLSLWKWIECWLQQTCVSRDSCSFHLPAQNLIKCIYIWFPDIHLKLSK